MTLSATPGVALSTDLGDPESVPYFLWDEPMTVSRFRERLRDGSEAERARMLGKLLREARDSDVWRFVSPEELRGAWPRVVRHLGRRRAFWEFLLARWKELGLLASP